MEYPRAQTVVDQPCNRVVIDVEPIAIAPEEAQGCVRCCSLEDASRLQGGRDECREAQGQEKGPACSHGGTDLGDKVSATKPDSRDYRRTTNKHGQREGLDTFVETASKCHGQQGA